MSAAKRQKVSQGELPTNPLVGPLMTDLYQLTMAYAYWRSGRHEQHSVFDLFFRKNPFKGEFTVFAGLDEVVKFIDNFSVSESDIEYLRSTPTFADCDPGFFDWLSTVYHTPAADDELLAGLYEGRQSIRHG